MFRKLLSAATSTAVVAGVVSAAAVGAATPAAAATYTPAPLANPLLAGCGIPVTLVLDASSSINEGEQAKVKQAANAFLDGLEDTNSTSRVVQFSGTSAEISERRDISGTPLDDTRADIASKYHSATQEDVTYEYPGTNWQSALWRTDEGLTVGESPRLSNGLVVFITDGDPTRKGTTTGSSAGLTEGTNAAIPDANDLKGRANRIIAVGVGLGANNDQRERLQQVSGPVIVDEVEPGKTINDFDVLVPNNFDNLAEALKGIASSLCGGAITIQKFTDEGDGGAYQPASDWNISAEVTGGAKNPENFTWIKPVNNTDEMVSALTAPTQTNPTDPPKGTVQFQYLPKASWNAKNPKVKITETLDPDFDPRSSFGYRCEFPGSNRVASQGDLTVTDNGNGDRTASFEIGAMTADLQLSCKIYNKHKTSSLKLVKKFVPADGGDASQWQMTATATPPGAPTYDKPGNYAGDFVPVWANTVYTLDEDGPDGFQEGTWSCNKGTLTGDSLTIPAGVSEVTCEITNTLLRTVTLQKEWVDGVEGDTAALAITGGSNGTAESTANGNAGPWIDETNQATATIGSGNTFTVGEELGDDNTGAYADPTTVCKAGEETLTPNQDTGAYPVDATDIVCTITNRRTTAKLTLVKQFDGKGDATKWTLSAEPVGIPGQGIVSGNGDPDSDGGVNQQVVFAGDYNLFEEGPAGYTRGQWVCVPWTNGDQSVEPAEVRRAMNEVDSVTLEDGDSMVCTIVNSRDFAQLKLIKKVSGGKAAADEFTLSADAAAPDTEFNFSNKGGSGSFKDVYAETVYTLSETGPDGYTRGEWVCLPASEPIPTTNQVDGQLNNGDTNKITLKKGQRVECTIVNTRDLGSLTITKSFNPKTSGYDKAFNIDYKCQDEAQGTVSLKAGETKTINGIPTGTECQVTEVKPTDPPAGWSFSDPVYDPANGKVTVTEKDKTVSVTVTNEILKPGINIVKTASATQVNPGETVTYTYTVTNTGDTELLNVEVKDDKCKDVKYDSGDTNGDSKLQTTEEWIYKCSMPISEATTNIAVVSGKDKNGLEVKAQDSFTVAVVSPVVAKKICPITVTLVKPKPKKVGNRVIVKKIKTKKSTCKLLKPVVLCRPLASSAAGEKAFCDTKVTKKGKIRVKTRGYDKVKVTVIVRSKPKKGFEDRWKPNTWRKSWILR